jgi:hypothetical protein
MMKMRNMVLLFLMASPLSGAVISCTGTQIDGNNPGDPDAGTTGNQDFGFPGCTNLQCQVANYCGTKDGTALSGVVNIPAGNLPLYGAKVYVPNTALSPLVAGASCDRCDNLTSGNPVTSATTDNQGRFTLANVPAGDNIPLVIQAGKWRRQVTIPHIDACSATSVDPTTTRLPRTQAEGNIPLIALTTGGLDALECLLRKLGIADSEFTLPTGTGRVHLYAGTGGSDRYQANLAGGASFQNATTLWGSLDSLKRYDVVTLSCEGQQYPNTKSTAARQAMLDYINLGGRVFASHYHNIWITGGPAPLPTVLTYNDRPDIGNTTADVITTFDRGAALADWLVNVGASSTRGKLPLSAAQNTVQAVNSKIAQAWLTVPSQNNVQYLSFDTPIGTAAAQQCGRMVLSDIHVASGDVSGPTKPFPSGCTTTSLSPQEKALIFILFDLSNCLVPVLG